MDCKQLILKGVKWWTWRDSIFRAICGICKLLNLKDVRCAECAYLAGSRYNLDTFLLKAFQTFCQFHCYGNPLEVEPVEVCRPVRRGFAVHCSFVAVAADSKLLDRGSQPWVAWDRTPRFHQRFRIRRGRCTSLSRTAPKAR